MAHSNKTYKISISGIVQGVGFRPFVYRLAKEMNLNGFVANTPAGVIINVAGKENHIEQFISRLQTEKPALSRIDFIQSKLTENNPRQFTSFSIDESKTDEQKTALITPDSDLCENCYKELFDPTDRRYLYPFTNCTDCGPRYTLITDLPYDRPYTTMHDFPMCRECSQEYGNPDSRRFHAEITACPVCGPSLQLLDNKGERIDGDPLIKTVDKLESGLTVAIKGIGGFHLAVDASNQAAIQKLREFKNRPHKPLAVMAGNIDCVRIAVQLNIQEERLLKSRQKPVVLLKKLPSCPLADNVAPDNKYIGVMLPYTPLHHLLFSKKRFPALVMTSGNLSGEPIVKDNDEAVNKLSSIADFFLVHDRKIITRNDDSVLRPDKNNFTFLRRARSYAPEPIILNHDIGKTLAVGPNMKNTICLTRGREAFVSQHNGELDLLATQQNFEEVISHLFHLLQVKPDLMVHDLHPDYYSTKYATTQDQIPTVAVQHHHAHAVAVMAEHNLESKVIAVTMDGTGFGPDGTIWGGEILLADAAGYKRMAHLNQIGMPGGEMAVREPWRMAVSHLYDIYGKDVKTIDLPLLHNKSGKLAIVLEMLQKDINSPLTSSCGRLFDTVAALLDIRHTVSFEGQAAMELEMFATASNPSAYPFEILKDESCLIMDSRPIIKAIIEDIISAFDKNTISTSFHYTLAKMITATCCQIRDNHLINDVVLSGGVFQNATLSEMLSKSLTQNNFTVYSHKYLPPNDGCISLGQAVAGRRMYGK